MLLPGSVEPVRDVPGRYEQCVPIADRVGIPPTADLGASIEHECGIGIAERAALPGHRVRRLMLRVPSRPEATHSAQRHRRIELSLILIPRIARAFVLAFAPWP